VAGDSGADTRHTRHMLLYWACHLWGETLPLLNRWQKRCIYDVGERTSQARYQLAGHMYRGESHSEETHVGQNNVAEGQDLGSPV